MKLQEIKDKRNLLSKKIIAVQTKALVTGDQKYVINGNNLMIEFLQYDNMLLRGDYE